MAKGKNDAYSEERMTKKMNEETELTKRNDVENLAHLLREKIFSKIQNILHQMFAKKGLDSAVMTMDLCRIVLYCESDYCKYFPLYPKPKNGAEYAFKLDLIVLLIPECRVENDKVKIVTQEGKKLEIDVSDLVADLIDHESMHMILYHLEGFLASKKLENLDNLLRHLFR